MTMSKKDLLRMPTDEELFRYAKSRGLSFNEAKKQVENIIEKREEAFNNLDS